MASADSTEALLTKKLLDSGANASMVAQMSLNEKYNAYMSLNSSKDVSSTTSPTPVPKPLPPPAVSIDKTNKDYLIFKSEKMLELMKTDIDPSVADIDGMIDTLWREEKEREEKEKKEKEKEKEEKEEKEKKEKKDDTDLIFICELTEKIPVDTKKLGWIMRTVVDPAGSFKYRYYKLSDKAVDTKKKRAQKRKFEEEEDYRSAEDIDFGNMDSDSDEEDGYSSTTKFVCKRLHDRFGIETMKAMLAESGEKNLTGRRLTICTRLAVQLTEETDDEEE